MTITLKADCTFEAEDLLDAYRKLSTHCLAQTIGTLRNPEAMSIPFRGSFTVEAA